MKFPSDFRARLQVVMKCRPVGGLSDREAVSYFFKGTPKLCDVSLVQAELFFCVESGLIYI